MLTIKQWLQDIGLSRYSAVFEANDIDLDILASLTQEDFARLGVSLGDWKRIQRAMPAAQLRTTTLSETVVAQPSPLIESVTVEGERRQVTVLFCDLVASTALSYSRDPEEYRGILARYHQRCIQAIQRFNGFVAQIQGDGVLAYFGYPLAHEGEADRALRAAFQILHAMTAFDTHTAAALRVRIGVATGLVVVSHILAPDKSAVGETPNLAARLQALAEPGMVMVSERTKLVAGGAFEFEDRGMHQLKGLSAPVRVWRVLGPSAAPSRFDAATDGQLSPMVGRETEVQCLLKAWRKAQGGQGQVMLLCGEAGIGKSRMLRALKESLGDALKGNLLYQCSPYHANSALHPFADHLARSFGFERDDDAAHKLDKIERGLAQSADDTGKAAHLIARLLAIPCDTRYGKLGLSAQREKDEIQKLLIEWIARQSDAAPSAVLFEDVHWADPSTREVLDALVRRTQALPLLTMFTYRPEFKSPWSGLAHVSEVTLQRLSPAASACVVMRLTGGKAMPSELMTLILHKTDGVPLFLEELTKAVLEGDILKDHGTHYEYSGRVSEVTIPATLHDSLMARLDRLIPVKEVAQLGAVLGRQFRFELLRAVSTMTEVSLRAALNKLVEAELIFPMGDPSNIQYVFKHALLQDAAYASLLKSKRQALHAQVAQTLEVRFAAQMASEPEVLAHHYSEADLHERAVPYWIEAGERALNRTALAEAAAHLVKALTVNNALPKSRARDVQELRIRMLLGTTYLSFKGHAAPEVLNTLEPARALAVELGDEEKLVPILFYMWMHHTARLDFDWGLKIVDQLDRLANATQDSYAFVVARNAENMTHGWMGRYTQACEAAKRGVRAYDPARHARYVHLYNHDQKCGTLSWVVHFLWMLGFPDQAQAAAQEQVDLARQLGHPFNLAFSLTTGCAALVKRGETEIARRWLAEADAVARENAVGYMTGFFVPFWSGVAQITDGVYAEGYAQLSTAWKFFEDGGGTVLAPWASVMKARALIGMGRFDDAVVLLRDALAFIERTKHRMHEAEVHRVLGEALWCGQRPDEQAAIACFNKALEVARAGNAKGWELRAAMSLATLWMERDRRRQAYDLLAPIHGWFTEGSETRDLKEASGLLAQLR